ncbi:MAG TPA: hypothetical protein ENK37_08475 [Oceanithermus profundus]|uniref:Uncharacterized protein n=1 Tax=Oceanithermus profundus TaxID=187137 RepID=A0A7C4V6I2_9DEIN|nr:hypothetical protein [Oceanithermus profundus]
MKHIQRLFRTPPQALPAEMLNLLIEVDNREGVAGLDRLEREIAHAQQRLHESGHPQAARLILWLKALEAYRATYHRRRPLRALRGWVRRRSARRAALASVR